MKITLFTSCIYVFYCGGSLIAGWAGGFFASAMILNSLGFGGSFLFQAFVGILAGLICAAVALIPALITHYLYSLICDKLFPCD